MAQQSEKIELSVTNFGPIAKADIDLRPLTVFVGPSNTGKTYLAVLTYALHKFFEEYLLHPSLWRYTEIDSTGRKTLNLDTSHKLLNNLQPNVIDEIVRDSIDWIDAVTSQGVQSDSSNKIDIPLPESLASVIRQSLADVSKFEELIVEEIERCFGIYEAKRLIRHSYKGVLKVDISRHIAQQQYIDPIKYELMIGRKESRFTSSIPNHTQLYAQNASSRRRSRSEFDYRLHRLKRHLTSDNSNGLLNSMNRFVDDLSEYVSPYLVGALRRGVHYLPAGRTGIMQAHRVVVGSMFRRLPISGIQAIPALPTLSGVVADFLEGLLELDKRRRLRWKDGSNLATSLENRMLFGEIQIEPKPMTGYPEFYYQPQGWKDNIPLMNSSSMVSELAPVVLYLRHIVRPGDAIIIEEPESHLHPAMQVEFIRQLAAAVKSGIQVIITTHSELVLEELGNLMKLSDLPKSQRKGIKGAEYALKYDQVGVWRFEQKERPKGSVVKEIKLHKEYGTFPSGFSEVAKDTYNDYAEISNRISGASING